MSGPSSLDGYPEDSYMLPETSDLNNELSLRNLLAETITTMNTMITKFAGLS